MANDYEQAVMFAMINVERLGAQNIRQPFGVKVNPFLALSDTAFVKTYRLSKKLTNYLIELVTPFIKQPKCSSALSVQDKVLITLQFFGTGSYQLPTGNSRYSAVSQSSVSRSISEITNALNQPTIFNSKVKFPKNIEELRKLRNEFYMKTGFPGVCECIGCTRIAIVAPSGNLGAKNNYPEHIYVNRKNYHSINTQLVRHFNNIHILYNVSQGEVTRGVPGTVFTYKPGTEYLSSNNIC
ncbi:unnamed protein product [Macrosiphum euphorbiae]|uniref:Nuclease HARBI1 n=1 Tax=Macrosiphum euphorbiae TaxID=13131 RepID=A0AAV0WNB6_9HEMI|nr:unnamed protein product [Macrosiphum euphorbiae]